MKGKEVGERGRRAKNVYWHVSPTPFLPHSFFSAGPLPEAEIVTTGQTRRLVALPHDLFGVEEQPLAAGVHGMAGMAPGHSAGHRTIIDQ